MAAQGSVCIAQPNGLALRLSAGQKTIDVELKGTGLFARTSAFFLNPSALCEFFRNAATGNTAPQGRWEYKEDDLFILEAWPFDQSSVMLSVSMEADAPLDQTDWSVDGTILLPIEKFREYAQEVNQKFGQER